MTSQPEQTIYGRKGFRRDDVVDGKARNVPKLGITIERPFGGESSRRQHQPRNSFSSSLFSPAMHSPRLFSPLPFSPLEFSPAGFSPLAFSPSFFPPNSFTHPSLKPLPRVPHYLSTLPATREDRESFNESSSDGTSLKKDDSILVIDDSPCPTPDPDFQRTAFQTVVLMASLCAAVYLAALDSSIITTALPTISEYFHSDAGYTWVGTAYLLADAASTPSWGKFSDIWGRKPILLLATAIFFVGSALAGASLNIGMLIFARGVQGIGGGGLNILVSICISDLFSLRRRGTFFGIIGMVWAFASATGPVLGGLFTQRLSWRWCFYVNLPITGTVFILLALFLHLDSPKTPMMAGLRAVDWGGTASIISCTLLLLLGLEFGGVYYPWKSPQIICLLAFGFFIGIFFILNEWKFAKYPVMPLRIFDNRSNCCALIVCFCHGFVYIAGTFYLPLYFQAVLGATPLMSGVYLLPFAMSLSGVSALTGIYIKKTGNYLSAIWFGMAVMTLGFGLLINLNTKSPWVKIFIFEILAGTGVGPNFQSPLLALQSMVKQKDVASATSTFSFTRNLACPFGVVVGSVVFQNGMVSRHASLVKSVGEEIASELAGGSAGSSVDLVNALPEGPRALAREAFAGSLQGMWAMYLGVLIVGCLVSVWIRGGELSDEHEVTKTGLLEEERARLENLEMQKAWRATMMDDKKGIAMSTGMRKEEV